jgi:hypothetical protein
VPPTVSATVSDESALSSVELRWDGPGNSGAAHMGRSGGGWSGRLDIEPVNGTWSYIVTATDERGNIGSAGGTLAVDGC